MPVLTLPSSLRTLAHDFLSLIYPEDCRACNGELAMSEELICSRCLVKLPYTDFHLNPVDNALHRMFWGRFPIGLAAAYLKYQERSRVQRLLHALKYRGQAEVSEVLGRWYGALLKQNPAFAVIEVVVPVPLHNSKRMERGYNQVSGFAAAIGKALEVPVAENALRKNKLSNTQTKKNRQERWEVMRQLYQIHSITAIAGRHVLLVDDVITTGATIEACAEELLNAGAQTVSVVSIAYTL